MLSKLFTRKKSKYQLPDNVKVVTIATLNRLYAQGYLDGQVGTRDIKQIKEIFDQIDLDTSLTRTLME